MAKNWDTVSSVIKDGKNVGTVVRSQNGTERTLLTPHGKVVKAMEENKTGVQLSNKVDPKTGKFIPKTDGNGVARGLSKLQRERNSGIICQAGASAAAYKGKGGKK